MIDHPQDRMRQHPTELRWLTPDEWDEMERLELRKQLLEAQEEQS